MQYLDHLGSSRLRNKLTEDMQEGPGGDRGDAAAAEGRFALVVATIADCWQANDQSAAEVSDPCADCRPVFPPSNTHFDKGSGEGRDEKGEKESRR